MCFLRPSRGDALTGLGFAWLALFLLVNSASFLRAAAEPEIAYKVVALPLAPISKPLLNDKGQVLTWQNGTVQMYLPTADYGLPAGVHSVGTMPAGGALLDFNTNGHFVTHTIQGVSEGALFKDGAVSTFPAQTVLGMDQLGRVLLQRIYSGSASTPAIRRLDGSFIDAVAVLPHKGVAGGDSYYFFSDMNDAGIAVGLYREFSTSSTPEFWRTAIWDTQSAADVQFLPSTGFYNNAKLVNNKNQILGHRDTGYVSAGGQLISTGRLHYIYLPAPDYGFPAGFTDLPTITQLGTWREDGSYDARFTDHGEIYIGGSQNPAPTLLWYRGQIISPGERILGTNTVSLTRIFDVNNLGSILATGTLNGQPGKLFILEPFLPDFFINAPARDEIVPPDEPYTIRFAAPTNMTKVNLYLVQRSLSSGGPRTLIAKDVPAAAGTNLWDVPANLLSPSTFVIAVDSADAAKEAISARFRVRDPWWLQRVVGTFQEPQYEPFVAENHAFSFLPQDENVMWRQDYWDRMSFEYSNLVGGFDPSIGPEVRYFPVYFGNQHAPDYPPWSGVVRAFGVAGTYESLFPQRLDWYNGEEHLYNQPNHWAGNWWDWRVADHHTYGGACYGVSLATMAAFQDPTRFDGKWLPSGGSDYLASFDNSDEVLDAVHALFLYQFGRLHQSEQMINQTMTPRELVARLKAMFERDDRDRDRFLHIQGYVDDRDENGHYRLAAHAIVPISMSREDSGDTEEGLYAVAVVDPNFGPYHPEGKDNPRFIWIHTGENWWHHDDGFWLGDTNKGIFLSTESVRAFETASTSWPHVLDSAGTKPAGVVKAQADAESLEVGIIGRAGAVTSGTGELRYEGGVITRSLPGGFISFPITGRPSNPDAYFVPSGVSYRAEAVPRADGVAGVRLSSGALTSSILQKGSGSPTRAVVNLLQDGMSVVSGGPGTFELTALTVTSGNEFHSIRAIGLVATNPANLALKAVPGGFRLSGVDQTTSYSFELGSSTGSVSRVFQHTNTVLPAGASHLIRPNWTTLGEGPVTIEVDRDGNGQTDETLVTANQGPSPLLWPGWVPGIPVETNLLMRNNGFESQPVGTRVSLPPGEANGSTFTGWRVFNVTTNSVAFTASIVANASVGSRAMRLAVTNTSATANHALDQWVPAMHTPVQLGQRYLVSFDAAWIAGVATSNLLFQVQEFDSAGNFLANGLSTLLSVSGTSYQTRSFIYRPVNPATAGIGLFFGPMRGVVGATTISLDNARLLVAPLLVNGDFESSRFATGAGGTGAFVNTTALLGWRLFSVGAPPITNLTGTIVDAGGYTGGKPGGHALRLAVTNTGSPAAYDYGLDNNNARTPVVTGKKYTLSFDGALVQAGGSLTLNVSIAEFNAAGTFTGTQGGFTPALPADQTFHRHTMTYGVTNPATTQVVIAFRPVTTGQSTLVLDNVVFAPFVADTPTGLSFAVNGATLRLTWPESHLGWRAQSNSVNVANPGAWFDVPGSASVTNLNFPISPVTPAVYYRLRRP